ncbi:MAG: TAXI family TRAP transporter solute-binding subunit [Brachymonas sp.]
MNFAKLYQHRVSWLYAPIVGLAVVAFLVLSQIWLPLPPSAITLSAGRSGGMYQEHAKAYRPMLQAQGIELNIVESAGTGENLQRLKDPANTVQVAFAQGGYALGESSDPDSVGIQTLAQIDIEPIWVFSRFRDVDSLLRLQGQRVAIGQSGSGSRAVALRLLTQVRLEAKDVLES